MASRAQGQAHPGDPIPTYLAVFGILTLVTVVECFPLFGLWEVPPGVLIVLSATKFLAVCYFFMHLLGDAPVFKRLFFVPLVMAIAVVAVLMTDYHTWRLEYRTTVRGTDSDAIAARYEGVWEGRCDAWSVSAATGNVYCASPATGTQAEAIAAAYAALKPSSTPDPRFEGFDQKSPEEKQAVLVAVGADVYGRNCAACHQANGEGVAGTFPPLKGDPVVSAGKVEEHLGIVLKGLTGKAINGVTYATAMPAWPQLSDQDIASVITYERNSWGNAAGMLEPAAVAKGR